MVISSLPGEGLGSGLFQRNYCVQQKPSGKGPLLGFLRFPRFPRFLGLLDLLDSPLPLLKYSKPNSSPCLGCWGVPLAGLGLKLKTNSE